MNKIKYQYKLSVLSLAVASLFAANTVAAENQVRPGFGFSWDGSKVLVNDQITGASDQTINVIDGAVIANINDITVTDRLTAVFGNYYKGGSSYVAPIGITLKNSKFTNNKVTGNGWFGPFFISAMGTIDSPKQTHQIEGSIFSNNSTVGYGGAIQTTIEAAGNTISEILISSSKFEKNHADQHGGAINLDNYDVTITDTTFDSNSAGKTSLGSGGGAIASNANKLVLNDTLFINNDAEGHGGAIYLYGANLKIQDEHGVIIPERQYRPTQAEFNVIKTDLTYQGNKVTGDSSKGGFLYIADDSISTFNVSEGRTLTIGEAGVINDKVDSIASADDRASIVKKGAGTMVINSSMEDFNGTFDVVQGNVYIDTLNMPGVLSVDAEEGSAVVTIDKMADNKLLGTVNAQRNGMVVIGSDEATVRTAMQKSGVTGGHGVIYVGKALDMNGGKLVVGADSTGVPDGEVVAKNGGVLMVDQTAGTKDTPIFSHATVNVDANSTLTLVNASVGTVNVADNGLTVNGEITTDNPFIEGKIIDGKLVSSLDAENGLTSIASTGIQAMTRHADFVMAETVADRTSIDQDLQPGMNLWATVRGERYESTEMDNGGTFRSDMGYGTFGADMALTDTITAGAALQYGKGSLRSDVSSIHNDIDNYGFTFYATKSFGPAKVVGELAYLQSKNDVTSSQTALNQEVDAKIYSAGVRAQYQLTTEHFQFVPSIGVRVSQLKTDAMNVGSVKVDDQEQTLVQLPIAMRINGYEQSASSGWTLAPSFKVAFVPTFGDKEITVLGHDQDVIDTTPVSADFGIRAKKGNVLLDANFIVGGGKDGTSSVGGKVGMKYVF